MKNLLLLVGLLLLASCAHHPDVRPGSDGINRVVIRTEDSEQGQREAIRQANSYCDENDLKPAFVEEGTKYTGDMNEKDYKTMKTVGKVSKTVGGTVWALGGKTESNVGGVVALGGVAADQIAGEGYTVEMKFRCQ